MRKKYKEYVMGSNKSEESFIFTALVEPIYVYSYRIMTFKEWK